MTGSRPHTGVSRSRLIVVLLALVSVLVLGLVWQAIQTRPSTSTETSTSSTTISRERDTPLCGLEPVMRLA